MLTGVELLDELKGDLAVWNYRDLAANVMLFKRLANEPNIRPIILDQHNLGRRNRRLRFSGVKRLGR